MASPTAPVIDEIIDSTFGRTRETYGFQSQVRDQQSATQLPPKPAGIPTFDRSCEKCSRCDFVVRDALTNLTNLSTSLMSGPWSEVYIKVGASVF